MSKASNKLFQSLQSFKNEAGGDAFKLNAKETLALLSTTSCLNNTLYVSAEKQLSQILHAALLVEPDFVAKCAVYSRELYGMKDVPALLCAVLAARKENQLLQLVFSRVINNGTMLRKFFEIFRSGATGRKSFGTAPKKLIYNWFNSRTPTEVWQQSVGTPSMRDILRCIRPRPLDQTRSALYAWLTDKPVDINMLPEKVQAYEKWKKDPSCEMPKVDFRMYTNIKLTTLQWCKVAEMSSWYWLMKNLNTLERHGVFKIEHMLENVVNRLVDPQEIKKASVFPYQILTAYQNISGVPNELKVALERAMEVATRNVPSFPSGCSVPAYIMTDVSGSMKYPITGSRIGATSVTRAVDVAALLACCFARNNPKVEMLFFNTNVVPYAIDPEATVISNATNISKIVTGGTACSAPLKLLNKDNAKSDLLICISDNQSWCESLNTDRHGKTQTGKTQFQVEWENYKERNPGAKLICIDIAPYATKQVQTMKDVLNLGGFSDTTFTMIDRFVRGEMDSAHIVGEISKFDLIVAKCFVTKEKDEEE